MDYRASEYLIPLFDYGVLHLELNTALYILVVFLIVTLALNRLLFRPVLRTLDNRAGLLAGISEENKRREAEIEQMDEDYRVRLEQVRADAAQFRQEQRRQAGQQATEILAAARREAEESLERAMGELDSEVARVREEALADVNALARRISERVLQR